MGGASLSYCSNQAELINPQQGHVLKTLGVPGTGVLIPIGFPFTTGVAIPDGRAAADIMVRGALQ